MSSYVQFLVGGMLLVTAFLVGRHINGEPIIATNPLAELADTDSIQLQANSSPPATTSSEPTPTAVVKKPAQRSLRERILEQRENQDSTANKLAFQTKPLAAKPFTLSDNDIVVPDFSSFNDDKPDVPVKQSNTTKEIVPRFPKLDSKTLPKKEIDDVVVGPRPTPRSKNNKSQMAQMPPRNKIIQISKPSSVLPKKQKRPTLESRQKTITGQLVPVRHRESRITTESQEFVDYTTVFGDTLHGLSIRFFGKPDYYLDIYLANKELFSNPSTVPVNTKLKIPVMDQIIERTSASR